MYRLSIGDKIGKKRWVVSWASQRGIQRRLVIHGLVSDAFGDYDDQLQRTPQGGTSTVHRTTAARKNKAGECNAGPLQLRSPATPMDF